MIFFLAYNVAANAGNAANHKAGIKDNQKPFPQELKLKFITCWLI